jgi:hypothetical protein
MVLFDSTLVVWQRGSSAHVREENLFGAGYLPVREGTRTLIPMAKASVQCEVVGRGEPSLRGKCRD